MEIEYYYGRKFNIADIKYNDSDESIAYTIKKDTKLRSDITWHNYKHSKHIQTSNMLNSDIIKELEIGHRWKLLPNGTSLYKHVLKQ